MRGPAEPVHPLVVRTPRLVLRPMTLELARAIVAGARGREWAAGFPQEGDWSVASLLVTAAEASPADVPAVPSPWGPWTISTGAGALIGTAGFHGPPRQDEVELGYGLAVEHRGRGLAGEAVGALLELAAELGVAAVVARVAPANEPSLRLLRRAGFEQVGIDTSTGELLLRRPAAVQPGLRG